MPSKVKIVTHEKAFKRMLHRGMEKNLDRAALMLVADIKQKFPGSGIRGTRSGATAKQRQGAARDRYGKIPMVQFGHLKRSVMQERSKPLVRLIGSSIQPGEYVDESGKLKKGGRGRHSYPLILELRVGKAGYRPWLRPALMRNRIKLRKELVRAVN